ncbi:MAG TPA: DUF4336 domain-containing protein [Sandaracinaceae bacterium LLY-WYZ-13_1]|nr:DUF4336 domain-containing protein [Sandaracinaceae bacterium LLY-WYZ-13_1]
MERLDEGIWAVARPLKMMGADFGTRMTVMRADDGLVLHSPVAPDEALADAIDALGPVRWLVAPCAFHHLFVEAAAKRWPDAEILAAPGVADKHAELAIGGTLPEAAPAAWDGALEALRIGGMPKLEEVVFLHRPSRTLVLTDFLFNVRDGRGWWTRAMLKMAGAWGGPVQSRYFRSLVKDREALRESRDRLLDWDFDRVTVCHGDVIDEAAKDRVAEATAWI